MNNEAAETLTLLDALSPLVQPKGSLIIQTVALAPGTSPGFRTEDWQGFSIKYQASMPWYYRNRQQWELDLTQLTRWQLSTITDILHPDTEEVLSWVIKLHQKDTPH